MILAIFYKWFYLRQQNPRDEAITQWKRISKQAEDEARKLSECLKESRVNKLHRKRKRTDSMQNLLPEGQKQKPTPIPLMEALHGLLHNYSKNEYQQQEYSGRGKGPANGRGYVKKGGPPDGQ